MYGGYGGMSSYGSSYGGYGSLGSSYGGYGGLGSSYNNRYGSYDSLNRRKPGTEVKGEKEGEDSNTPKDPNQRTRQQQNADKKVVEQWFKMMGGLRSILQLGFAFIALTNFCMTTSELVKKLMAFSKQKSLSMAKYIQKKMPTKTISNLMSPQKRTKTIKMMLVMMMRIFTAVLIVVGLKLKRDMRRDAQKREKEMQDELQKLKQQEQEIQSEMSQMQRRKQEGANHDANL